MPDGEGWAQMYVRNSYDREVVGRCGSLFGVLFTKGVGMGDGEVEVFRKIEEISSNETHTMRIQSLWPIP